MYNLLFLKKMLLSVFSKIICILFLYLSKHKNVFLYLCLYIFCVIFSYLDLIFLKKIKLFIIFIPFQKTTVIDFFKNFFSKIIFIFLFSTKLDFFFIFTKKIFNFYIYIVKNSFLLKKIYIVKNSFFFINLFIFNKNYFYNNFFFLKELYSFKKKINKKTNKIKFNFFNSIVFNKFFFFKKNFKKFYYFDNSVVLLNYVQYALKKKINLFTNTTNMLFYKNYSFLKKSHNNVYAKLKLFKCIWINIRQAKLLSFYWVFLIYSLIILFMQKRLKYFYYIKYSFFFDNWSDILLFNQNIFIF